MKILRTGALLILLSVLLVVAGGAIGGQNGMKIALGFAVLMNGISYFFSDKIALASSVALTGGSGGLSLSVTVNIETVRATVNNVLAYLPGNALRVRVCGEIARPTIG